jgi:hypothetical protein
VDLEANCNDPHLAAALLKHWFSMLPEPIFLFSSFDAIQEAMCTTLFPVSQPDLYVYLECMPLHLYLRILVPAVAHGP